MTTKTLRGDILDIAKTLTETARQEVYGEPVDNLERFSLLLEGYLRAKYAKEVDILACDISLNAQDAAWFMVMLKQARALGPKYHKDNYVDAAAYSAIAGECSLTQSVSDFFGNEDIE